jgi:hypothetical protein
LLKAGRIAAFRRAVQVSHLLHLNRYADAPRL